MPTPQEQAAEGLAADAHGVVEAADDPSLDDTNPIPAITAAAAPPAEPAQAAPPAPPVTEPPQPNRPASAALIAGILGVTGIGVLLGLGFGTAGLVKARTVGTGRVRSWIAIAASLLWAGAFLYAAPHVIKAADPGCTYFKEKALPHYDAAIVDLDTRAGSNKTTADLATAVAGLESAAARSRNSPAKDALRTLTSQLMTASNDQIAGQIPSSVMRTLNHDTVLADNACGTI
ncbi:MAG: hypothetical protein ACRDNF_14135 [Streptosporangiaceae bacterium]